VLYPQVTGGMTCPCLLVAFVAEKIVKVSVTFCLMLTWYVGQSLALWGARLREESTHASRCKPADVHAGTAPVPPCA
jgi:hypothetical protein